MKYIILRSPTNNFSEELNDPVIKKSIRTKIEYTGHLILTFNSEKDEAYFLLKYGDRAISMRDLVTDRSPIMDIDYAPDRNNGYWRSRKTN